MVRGLWIMEAQELFEDLDAVRRHPNLTGVEGKSLTALKAFLSGYETGLLRAGDKQGMSLRAFNTWVAKELGFAESTSGWCNMILARAESEDKAFDMFFELLDRFRGRSVA
jgi:hypothetical protein